MAVICVSRVAVSAFVKSTLRSISERPQLLRTLSLIATTDRIPRKTTCYGQEPKLLFAVTSLQQCSERFSSQVEWYCLTYDDLISHLKKDDIFLIDVREPAELQTYGSIPTAVNIPLRELSDALNMSPERFKVRYDRDPPSDDGSEVVFHCMAGVRSLRALQLAWDKGLTKARHLPGGFDEWQMHQLEKNHNH